MEDCGCVPYCACGVVLCFFLVASYGVVKFFFIAKKNTNTKYKNCNVWREFRVLDEVVAVVVGVLLSWRGK